MRIDTSEVVPPFRGRLWLARTAILMHQNADNYRRHKQHRIVPDQRMKLATTRKTDQVIASARKELEAQLAAVRDEIARLTAEERALTHAVSNLDGGNPATSAAGTASKRAVSARPAQSREVKSSTGKRSPGRRRRARTRSKSTADRLDDLRGLLGDGPKSRSDLAAALKVSPARVQQLLAELGSSVSSRPDPNQRRGKLWSLDGDVTAGGTGAGNPAKRGRRTSTASTKQSRRRSGTAK